MTKVALRVYNREIETMIDQGHLDEAIAHCQYILKTYSKYLEPYRLLGKAYLESHRYPDAEDIFQRVLLAVPDDFVSHLGMSIIRDEQKDLDAGIWHMERAFEINPSNAGVQEELRRLYGRRDGLEPPKIRLTRGALAQMYVKGGQYQQAVAEIKAVLAEDATRNDMKVLLARAYYQGGQKVEAVDVCTDLLKQYPYCLDGNRILVEVLPGTSLAQSVDVYRKRVQALDPYAAFVSGSIFEVANVPDNAVGIERLEWDASSPMSLDAPEQPASSVAATNSDANIPDWMKEAGWEPSSGEAQEGPVETADETSPADDESAPELAAAEIPDWLKAMAPPGAASQPQEEKETTPDAPVAQEDLDWLAGLGTGQASEETAQPEAGTNASAKPELQAAKPAEASPTVTGKEPPSPTQENPQPAETGEVMSTPNDQPPQPSEQGGEDLPDWLKDIGSAPQQPAAQPEPQPAAQDTNLPDWLQEQTPTPNQTQAPSTPASTDAQGAELDWLRGLAGETPAAGESTPAASQTPPTPPQTPPAPTASQPSQGQQAPSQPAPAPQTPPPPPASQQVAPAPAASQTPPQASHAVSDEDEEIPPLSPLISGPGTSEVEQDDAMKWLESLAQKQGAKAEELITNPDERKEQLPDWVNKVQDTPDVPVAGTPVAPAAPAVPQPKAPAASAPEPPAEVDAEPVSGELSPLISEPGTTEMEQDDAMKWLESLAQKQGAKAEELITNPNERKEQAPEWVDQVQKPPTTAPVPAPASTPETKEPEQDDTLKWLDGLAAGQNAKPEEKPAVQAEQQPGLTDQMSNAQESPTQSTPPASESDDTDAWLKSLVSDQNEAPQADSSTGQIPAQEKQEPAKPLATEDDWLAGLRTSDQESGGTMPWEEQDSAQNESLPTMPWDQPATETPPQAPEPPAPSTPPVPAAPAESAPAQARTQEESIPEWLQKTNTPVSQQDVASDELPDWLKDRSADEQPPQPSEVSNWVPADAAVPSTQPPSTPPTPAAATSASVPETPPPSDETELVPLDEPTPPAAPEPASEQPEPIPAAPPAATGQRASVNPAVRQTAVLDDKDGPVLYKARELLGGGALDEAMAQYAKLIKKGKLLEEAIYDLQEATYRHPVDVVVWQTLGDAYTRANRLQEALDSYTKAEELLR